MSSILEIQAQIRKVYEATQEPALELPLCVQALEWLALAREYLAAAALVSEHAEHLWLSRLQLTGQAVELALKACLAAADEPPPLEHDLVKLYVLVAERSHSLSEPDQAAIVHLAHFYHQDLATKTKFKARYPTGTSERLGGAVPYHATYADLVRSLCAQAERATNQRLAQYAEQAERR